MNIRSRTFIGAAALAGALAAGAGAAGVAQADALPGTVTFFSGMSYTGTTEVHQENGVDVCRNTDTVAHSVRGVAADNIEIFSGPDCTGYAWILEGIGNASEPVGIQSYKFVTPA